jgi:hypothetical protein
LTLCLTNEALCHEEIWESGYIDPRILDLCTSWWWMVGFIPWLLYTQYPLDRKLGEPQNRSGWRGKEINLSPTRTRNSNLSDVQSIAIYIYTKYNTRNHHTHKNVCKSFCEIWPTHRSKWDLIRVNIIYAPSLLKLSELMRAFYIHRPYLFYDGH